MPFSAKPAVPQPVTDQRNVLETWAILFWLKDTAEQRSNTKQREDIPRVPLTHQPFRVAARIAQVEKIFNASGDIRKDLRCVLQSA